jgi:hypothetical protein
MSLKLVGVEDAGDLDSERVVLRADAATGIGRCILLHAKRSPEGKVFSGPVPGAYWFATMSVRAGDLVVLYTKRGQRSQKPQDDGATSHFFYWGLPAPIWGPDYKPALVSAAGWTW